MREVSLFVIYYFVPQETPPVIFESKSSPRRFQNFICISLIYSLFIITQTRPSWTLL